MIADIKKYVILFVLGILTIGMISGGVAIYMKYRSLTGDIATLKEDIVDRDRKINELSLRIGILLQTEELYKSTIANQNNKILEHSVKLEEKETIIEQLGKLQPEIRYGVNSSITKALNEANDVNITIRNISEIRYEDL